MPLGVEAKMSSDGAWQRPARKQPQPTGTAGAGVGSHLPGVTQPVQAETAQPQLPGLTLPTASCPARPGQEPTALLSGLGQGRTTASQPRDLGQVLEVLCASVVSPVQWA